MNNAIIFAKEELQKHLDILGVKADISLGLFSDFDISLNVEDPYYDDAIAISVTDRTGYIAGSNERSVLIGVYRLLEEWGICWMRPGKLGTYYPKDANTIDVNILEKAARRHRIMCIEGAVSIENVINMIDWIPKVGFNGYYIQFSMPYEFFDRWYSHTKNPLKDREGISEEQVSEYLDVMKKEIKKRGLLLHSIGHGWTCTLFGVSDKGWYKVDPDEIPDSYKNICALVNGKRAVWNNKPLHGQLCYSNPYVKKTLVDGVVNYVKNHPETDVVHFWLGDYFNNTCECEECTKTVYTDYYVRMINDITDELQKLGTKTKLLFCVYYNTSHPPVTEKIKHPEQTVLMFAPITRSFGESFPNHFTITDIPQYKVNKYELVFGRTASVDKNLAYLHAWKECYNGDAVDFDYHLMWDHILDASQERIARTIYDDVRNIGALGMNGFISCQLQRNSFPTSIAMTIMGKTLWNTDTDFEKTRRKLYAGTFGDDMTDVMSEYFSTISRAFDIAAIRNLKDFDAKEFRVNMKDAVAAMDNFGEIIEKNLTRTEPAQRESWKYLLHHRYMYTLVGRAILLILDGKREDGKELIEKAIQYAWEVEDDIQPVLDTMYFCRMINERITIDSNAQFTVV